MAVIIVIIVEIRMFSADTRPDNIILSHVHLFTSDGVGLFRRRTEKKFKKFMLIFMQTRNQSSLV